MVRHVRGSRTNTTTLVVTLLILLSAWLSKHVADATCASDSEILRETEALQLSFSQLQPSELCEDDAVTNRTTCTLEYGTARGNSDQYKTTCIDEGGQFYRYDAVVLCVGDVGNNATSDDEVHIDYPDCVASTCSTTDNGTEAIAWFAQKYGTDCNVNISLVEGPIYNEAPVGNATQEPNSYEENGGEEPDSDTTTAPNPSRPSAAPVNASSGGSYTTPALTGIKSVVWGIALLLLTTFS